MKQTIEQLLTKTSDKELLEMQMEIHEAVVPATGYLHSFCKRANRMIDQGELCINPTSYRKVYLPTLVKLVEKELADRYLKAVKTGRLSIITSEEL